MRTSFSADIVVYADREGLEPDLVESLVIQESGGNPWAINPEPRYPYFWNVRTDAPYRATEAQAISKVPPDDFPRLIGDRDQEWWCQQCSWGLMQIMGAVARERGFRGVYLTELTNPQTNLVYGCLHLGILFRWAQRNEQKALGAYNAGRGGWDSVQGVQYAQKVLNIKAGIQIRPRS